MKYKINSIVEYLSLIEKKKMKNYIFRGQNEPYSGINASGFRPYLGSWSTDKPYDLEKMTSDFYKKVVRILTIDEKKHFLAYAQHHGLPTNLVDFSYSPLIALFFACHGKSSPKFSLEELVNKNTYDIIKTLNEDKSVMDQLIHNLINQLRKDHYSPYAQLYLISKEKLIDVTKIMMDYGNKNIFYLLEEKQEVRLWLYKELESKVFNENTSIIDWLSNIIDVYDKNKISVIEGTYKLSPPLDKKFTCDLKTYRQKIRNENTREESIRELYTYLINEIEDENITLGNMYQLESFEDIEKIAICIYIALIINMIQVIKNSNLKIEFQLDFYFTYSPPEIFDRISNQKGIFVNQPYVYEIDEIYNYGNLVCQKIVPDITIEIENYQKVLSELNYLGINSESIYSDVDHIAQAVKYSHDEILYNYRIDMENSLSKFL